MKPPLHTHRIRTTTCRINTNKLAITLAAIAITAVTPSLSAQETTFFGERLGGGGVSTPEYSLKDSVFYDTVWSFRARNGNIGAQEFRQDGTVRHYDGHKEYPNHWSVSSDPKSREIFIGNEKWELSANGETLLQMGHRLWYRGTTPPPPLPKLRESLADPNVYWQNGNSQYVFSSNGTWAEYYKGNKKTGTWEPWYGNVISLSQEKDEFFILSEDGNYMLKKSGRWEKRLRSNAASSTTKPASGTASGNAATKANVPTAKPAAGSALGSAAKKTNVPTSQTIAEGLSTLKKQRDTAISTALTRFAKSNETQLETIKRRAISGTGQPNMDLIKDIQGAQEAIKRKESFANIPLKFRSKPSSLEREFAKFMTKYNNGIFANYETVEARFKRGYENLRKQALTINDIVLAQKIQDEIDSLFPAESYILANLWNPHWIDNEIWEFKNDGKYFNYNEKTGKYRRRGKWEFRKERGETGIRIDGNNDWQHWFSPDRKRLRNPGDGGTLVRINRD
jgi:hypothetical protein